MPGILFCARLAAARVSGRQMRGGLIDCDPLLPSVRCGAALPAAKHAVSPVPGRQILKPLCHKGILMI